MPQPPMFPRPQNPDVAYYEALGEFIDEFAKVEAALHLTLWRYAKTPAPIAQAVFSGVRVDGAISFINRIFEVADHSDEAKADLGHIFKQLKLINDARNLIIHYGSVPVPNMLVGRVSTNALVALTEERLRSIPASARFLDDMTSDLRKIQMHLIVNHFVREPGVPPPYTEDELALLTAAWRHRPPPPKRRRSKTPDRSPTQPPPPESSQG